VVSAESRFVGEGRYPRTIDAALIKRLSILQPGRGVFAIAFDWAVIAAAIVASEQAGRLWVYLLAVAIIAGRMHALAVLMHEGAHFRLFNSRRMNDWISDIFVAWPIFATTGGYRRNHTLHHRHANTADDPDWTSKLGAASFTFPQKAVSAGLHLLGYLTTIASVRDAVRLQPLMAVAPVTRARRLARWGYYAGLAVLVTALGVWPKVILYWIVPYFTLFFLFQHVRSVAEHFGSMTYSSELGSTRSVRPYLWERWFFAPHHINRHLEHHLYPGIPFYNLPALHDALMRDPAFASSAHVTRGYTTGLVRECLAKASDGTIHANWQEQTK